MFGVPETAPLEPEGYTPEVTQRVYALLAVKAAAGLAAQKHVVVDAVFSKPGERTAIERVARDAGYAFQGFWLDAEIGAMRDRVAARRHDASDATVEIVEHQSGYDVGAITWHRIDAGGTTSETLQRALAVLND